MKIQKSAALLKFVLAASTLALSSASAFADTSISGGAAVQGIAGASGLAGTFYSVQSGSTNFAVDATLAALAANSPVGTFVASTINYGGNDGSNINDFLGADAASYSGVSGSMSDGILEMKGYLQVSAPGAISFAIHHDDAAQLSIGGQVVISSGCCGDNSAVATFSNAGFYAIDMVYANTIWNGGTGGASMVFTVNGNLGSANLYQDVTAVPEPETYGMLLAGLGLMAVVARRRKNV